MSMYTVTLHEPTTVDHTVLIGDGTVIWRYTTIAAGVMIGKRCIIGSCCFLGPHCVIGDDTRLHHSVALPANTRIGARCYLGVHVCGIDLRYLTLPPQADEVHAPPVIEDDVVVGCNAVLLPGVILHAGAIIGAGSVVTRDVAARTVVAGNPARPLRTPRRKLVVVEGTGQIVGGTHG